MRPSRRRFACQCLRVIPPQHAELLCKDAIKPIKVCAISARGYLRLRRQPDFPPQSYVRGWIKQQRPLDIRDSEPKLPSDKAWLLELPAAAEEYPQPKVVGTPRGKLFDPVVHLKQLKFVDHLKDVRHSPMALEDAIDLIFHDNHDKAEEMRALTPKLVGRSQLLRSRLQLDSVSNLIDRREFKQLFKTDPDMVTSIHVYSDGSPVTGSELQGMVLDIV